MYIFLFGIGEYDFSVHYFEIQSVNLIFRNEICRKIGKCKLCFLLISCHFLRLLSVLLFRHIQIIDRNFIDSLRSIISHFLDMLSHHALIMLRRCRTIVYCCSKSGTPCKFCHSPDIFQMAHTIIISFAGTHNYAIYCHAALRNGSLQSIQI